MPEKKIFILDTNVLIHDPKSIFAFDGAHIGIPSTVLEEIDQFKREGTERGRNARESIRLLDQLREKGSLKDGVKLDNGSILQVIFYDESILKKAPLSPEVIDNKMLFTALALKQEGYNVYFISKDLNARVKADALGIHTEDYLKEEYVSEKEFYQGWLKIPVPAVELKGQPTELIRTVEQKLIQRNEFILAESQNNPNNNKIFRYHGGDVFKPVYHPNLAWPLTARNPQQIMGLDLLLDPEIQFVCLFGPAGTGKTFLALLAGLHQIFITKQYDRMLISRPVVPLGRDIGFLPGTVEEKMHSWMLPIYDNMNYIMHTIHKSSIPQEHEEEVEDHRNKKRKKGHHTHHNQKKTAKRIMFEDLLHQGKIAMEPITYMRGRTIPYQFIIIDEAQNLNPHEIKTLVTRVGEGSKIILTGDPYQIDSPYLDFSSNGLVVASERFKGQKIFGSVFLPTSERSELSKLAGELL